MILLLGEAGDPHIKKVSRALSRLKAEYLILDPLESVRIPSLRAVFGSIRMTERRYSAIWDRLKPLASGTLDERDQFIVRERIAAVRSLQLLHEDQARLMNHPLATERARSKPFQLAVAMENGLRIPKTYVGNDHAEISTFIESCPSGVVAKSLTWFAGSEGRFFFTSRIRQSTITSSPAAAAYSPLIYQEHILKKYELRITCVGPTIFAARILSQQNPKAKVDWRRDQFNLTYEETVIPADLERRIEKIRTVIGLEFATFDLIVTPDDHYVFLEVNATGNWMWLEKQSGFPISACIAEWLVRGPKHKSTK